MNRVALAAVLVAASSTAASAGTYLGLGIGSTADTSATVNRAVVEGNGRSGRLIVGGSILGRLAIEGTGERYGVLVNSIGNDATQLGIGLKLNFPLGNNFEVFGRGGLQRTWFSSNLSMDQGGYDAAGNGYYLGAGFEYRLSLGLTAASIFVDYQRSSTSFSTDSMPLYDTVSSMWTLGFTVGI